MAEKREIIIEIEVDNNQAQKNLERTTSQIRTLQNERKELNAQIKKSDSQLRAEGTTRKEVNKQIVENELATKRLSEEKRKAIKEVNLENNSLNALRNNLSKLTNERNNVNTGTAEGAKRFRELNKEILAQNESIKKLEEAGGDFRRSVGNYGVATKNFEKTITNLNTAITNLKKKQQEVDVTTKQGAKEYENIQVQINNYNKTINSATQNNETLITSLTNISPAFEGVTSSIGAMTKSALAFIATPLGLILAAIAAAVALVANAMDRSEENTNKVRKAFSAFSGIISGVLKALEPLGEYLIDGIVKGFDLAAKAADSAMSILSDGLELLGFDSAAKNVREFTEEIKEAVAASSELSDAEANLRREQRLAQKVQLDYQKQAEKLRQVRDDETLSFEKRIKANKDLGVVLNQQLAEEKRIAQVALDVANLRIQLEGETSEALDERAEALTNIADIEERITGQRSEQLVNLNSLEREQTQVKQAEADKQKAIDAKIADDKAKQDDIDKAAKIEKAAKEEELRQREIDANIELQVFKQSQREFDAEAEILLEETKAKRLLENTELVESEKQLIKEESNAKILALQKKAVDNEIKQQERQVAQTSALFGDLSTVVKSLGVEFKGLAIGQAIIDTYAAANAALRSGSALSPLAGIAAAAGAVVTGLANVATIKNQKFALGGMVVGPSHANGGVKFAVGGRVNELEGGEAVINKRSTKMFAPVLSAMNVAGGGVKFANGGITDFSSASSIDSEISGQNQIMSLINSLPSPIVRVTDINDTQNTVKVTQETASL